MLLKFRIRASLVEAFNNADAQFSPKVNCRGACGSGTQVPVSGAEDSGEQTWQNHLVIKLGGGYSLPS